MHRAECVGYKYVGKGCEPLCEPLVVICFLLMKADVFKQEDLPVLKGRSLFLSIGTYNVARELDTGFRKQSGKPCRNGRKRVLFLKLALWPAKMGTEYNLSPLVN